MYSSVTHFNNYINNFEDSTDTLAIKNMILASAESVVEEYLGYDPISAEAVEYHRCQGHSLLYPNRMPITLISEVLQNGEDITEFCSVRNNMIYSDKLIKGANIKITYTAGWQSNSIPPVILHTVLRIAALMYSEANGSIGLSSRTSPDGSKTYISYNNYVKYLTPLEKYRRLHL